MMDIKIFEPNTKDELEKYYDLRWKILRSPLNQPRGTEKDEKEATAFHAAALIEGEIVGVGRLHLNSEKEAQLRYMAVEEKYRGKGIGTLIIKELEKRAKEKGAEYIVLDARENAVEFYKFNDYKILEKSYLLFDSIQHWKMRKTI